MAPRAARSRLRRQPVDASAQAYQLLASPDATLGAVSYSVTAALAGLGGDEPAVALAALLTAKAAVDLGWARS